MMAHNVYTTINSWYLSKSFIPPSIFRTFWLPWNDMGHFLWKFTPGKLLNTPCYLSSKSPFQIIYQAFGLPTFLSQMFNSKYFLSWEKEGKKTVKLVSSGGNYQYQWTLISCFCMGDWQKYLKYESGFYP